MSRATPPRLARLLLRLAPLGERRHEVEADLLELFAERSTERGGRYARRRYYGDVLSLWRRGETAVIPNHPRARAQLVREAVQDMFYALRLLRRSPGVVVVAVLGLGLAIGVGTSVFSLLNASVFRPTGIVDPSSAVRVMRADQNGFGTSWPYLDYRSLREHARDVTLDAWLRDDVSFSTDRQSETPTMTSVTFVTGGYLGSLNSRTTLGRLLSISDDVPGAPPVVVVSHTMWSRTLLSDPAVVGRPIWLNGVAFTVVGVAARGFSGMVDANPAIWAPIASYQPATGGPPVDRNPALAVEVVARLGPGVRREQAQSSLSATAVSIAGSLSRTSESLTGVRLMAITGGTNSADAARRALTAAMVIGIVGLVLLLACVNVTNLLLASATTRQRELGVRLALGASRWRIVRQLLTESLALGLAGGLSGLLFTTWLLPILARVARAPASIDLTPDVRVYVFLGVISVLAGLGAGLVPARHAMRDAFASPLKDARAASEATPRTRSSRSVLVAVQAGASLVLLVVAGLMARGMVRATTVDVGFDASQLLTVSPAFGRGTYDAAGARAYWDLALERVRAQPGVRSASLASVAPFGGGGTVTVFRRHSGGRYTIHHNATRADYFATIGLHVVRGRTYTAAEASEGAPVAVISETLMRDFFPGEDPVGQSLQRILEDSRATIVGVVSNAITARLRDLGSATIYQPMHDTVGAKLVVRSAGAPDALIPSLRSALHPLDPRARLTVTLVSAGLQDQVAEPRALATIAGALAGLALALAVLGLYGVTAFVVGQRAQEIGVRMALGATARDVMRLLVRDSLRPVLFGLLGGIVVALGVTRAFAGALYGVPSADPISFGLAILLLLGAATAAIILPTRRASSIDPAAVLRQL